jgi:hypothetical protein
MRDKFEKLKEKLQTPVGQRLVGYSVGVIVGSSATAYYFHKKYGWEPGALPLILPKDAYQALLNDETNVVRFAVNKTDQVFNVTYEQ